MGEFIQRAPRTGLAIVISDLFDQEGFRDGVDRLRYARFEPHVVQIHTTQEAAPSLLGDVELIDCETGIEKKVTVTERKLRQYKELFESFIEDVSTYCQTQGLSHTRTTTEVPFRRGLARHDARCGGGVIHVVGFTGTIDVAVDRTADHWFLHPENAASSSRGRDAFVLGSSL